MLDSNNYILEKYIEYALGTYKSGALFYADKIMFRCPFCNDWKRRAYILKNNPKDKNRWVFTCFNGDCVGNNSMKATTLLKEKFPGLYDEYRKELFVTNRQNKVVLEHQTFIEELVQKPIDEKKDTKGFISIVDGKGKLFDKAKEYCKYRLIPEDVWSKWFVSIDGRFQGRLIIPFFDNDNKIYYYQGRSLSNQDPKYLSRRIGERQIYNIYNIDKSHPVMITEGPIDSIFLDNAIATIGIKHSENIRKELEQLQQYYIFDNDVAGNKIANKYLENGKYVFNWFKFLKDNNLNNIKDINDYSMISGKTKILFDDLKIYFTNNIYDKVWFKK